MQSYQNGLTKKTCEMPEVFHKLREASLKKGRAAGKKFKEMAETKSCKGDMAPLSDSEKKALSAWMENDPFFKQNQLLHVCSRTKTSGGSAGEKRFIMIANHEKNGLQVVELKPLVNPAPDIASPLSRSDRQAAFVKSVQLFLGKDFESDYYPVVLENKLYQRRPLWSGVQSLEEQDFKSLPDQDKARVILFQACELGSFHGRIKPQAFNFDAVAWDKLARQLEDQFRKEFGE